MKKIIAALFASLLLITMFGVISASAEPGPNGNNNKGLCTAYFNGQKKGHDKHGDPGPFQALEDQAAENDGRDNDGDGDVDEDGERIDDSSPEVDLEQAEAVYVFCDGLIGGNPSNGRYDCESTDDGPSCTDGRGGGAEGKGKNKNG